MKLQYWVNFGAVVFISFLVAVTFTVTTKTGMIGLMLNWWLVFGGFSLAFYVFCQGTDNILKFYSGIVIFLADFIFVLTSWVKQKQEVELLVIYSLVTLFLVIWLGSRRVSSGEMLRMSFRKKCPMYFPGLNFFQYPFEDMEIIPFFLQVEGEIELPPDRLATYGLESQAGKAIFVTRVYIKKFSNCLISYAVNWEEVKRDLENFLRESISRKILDGKEKDGLETFSKGPFVFNWNKDFNLFSLKS